MKRNKHFYGFLAVLFVLIMLCKASAFHVYTHDTDAADEIENCSICDVAVKNQNSEIFVPTLLEVNAPFRAIALMENTFTAPTLFHDRLQLYDHNCRPPPFSV